MPAPPIELILTVVLNCGFCQNAGCWCNRSGVCGRVTNLLKRRNGELEDIGAFESPRRLVAILCIRAWNTTRPPPSCLRRVDDGHGDITDVTVLVH